MSAYKNSYWNGKGQFKSTIDAINQKLMPKEGACPKECPKLEKLRVAQNCYYDLFNNGLGNRAAEFRGAFGFSPRKEYSGWRAGRRGIDFQNEQMNLRLNLTLDRLIVEAALENGVPVVQDDGKPALAAAFEFGFRCAEKQMNLQQALEEFARTWR